MNIENSIILTLTKSTNELLEAGKLKNIYLSCCPPINKFPLKIYIYENGEGGRHKVVNEWICVIPYKIHFDTIRDAQFYVEDGYELFITNLKTYDNPKDITDFKKPCMKSCLEVSRKKGDCATCGDLEVLREPPIYWCEVEGI